MTATYPKRLIEVDLPIKRISAHARREKSIRHGHISTLHIWWARRPLAACRAVICASLWPDPADPACPQAFRDVALQQMTAFAKAAHSNQWGAAICDADAWKRYGLLANGLTLDPAKAKYQQKLREYLLDFIADFAAWEASTNRCFLDTARALTQAAHEGLGGEAGTRPLVVDPFAGGGAIPLEGLRVGADAFASDLNPVAVLLNKITLEYVPKYGQRLADEIRKRGQWVKKQAETELGAFYPRGDEGATSIAYLWARTAISSAPGAVGPPIEVPLIRSMALAKKPRRLIALSWVRDKSGGVATQEIKVTYADGQTRLVAQPMVRVVTLGSSDAAEAGTSSAGSATCPVSGYTMPVEAIRTQLAERGGGAFDSRLLCVATVCPGEVGRTYRLPTEADLDALKAARRAYNQIAHDGSIPNEQLNHLRGFFNIVLYGMTSWGSLFTPRQALVLVTLTRLIREVGKETSAGDPEFSTALQTCLAMVVGRMADGNSSLASWQNTGEKIGHTFGRQALPMVWDYAEANPFCSATRSLDSMFEWIAKVVEHECCNPTPGRAEQACATQQLLPDCSVDAVITDPPYYSAVPYADLSDFFYTWITRSIRDRHPKLLADDLTPKSRECVSLSHRAAMYREKDKAWFEMMMTRACSEAARITRPHGLGVFVFASKETAAWEAMIQAIIDAGWTVTASWPIDTEMGTRLRAMNSATLSSSIHIACRPRVDSRDRRVGDWRDVLTELPDRTREWMARLSAEGVVGADAIFACLGPALEIFSRYARVEKASGEKVTLREYLTYIWGAVSQEALAQVFQGADTTAFEEDARLTAMWLWTLNAASSVLQQKNDGGQGDDEEEAGDGEGVKASADGKANGYILEFDAARKIAQGLGAHLEQLADVVEVKGDKARLLSVAERTRRLFGKDEAEAPQTKRRRKDKQMKLFGSLDELESEEAGAGGWGEKSVPKIGQTVLDRVHQSMILFAAGRSEALKRFLTEDGAGRDGRFWKLAQALSALYPQGTDEKRWVDGVLARKKGLGL